MEVLEDGAQLPVGASKITRDSYRTILDQWRMCYVPNEKMQDEETDISKEGGINCPRNTELVRNDGSLMYVWLLCVSVPDGTKRNTS